MLGSFVWVLAIAGLLPACDQQAPTPPEDGDWISLFNGRDLSGWTPKFAGHPLGENILDTFRVEDGVLKVSYDNYDTLDGRYGHLFYEKPYSHYWLRLEYRFVGDQVPDAPEWAFRNNGVLFHTQPPETMKLEDGFPIGVEMRFLGGDGYFRRTTGGVCSMGVTVVIEGERSDKVCTNPFWGTHRGDQWVRADIEVQGGDVIRHYIDGKLVMEYGDLVLDEDQPWSPTRKLESGYIAIQAETHPTEFRRIEILNLDE